MANLVVSSPYISTLHIEGTIQADTDDGFSIFQDAGSYRHSYVMGQIKRLENDSNNLGIMLYVDTPGGTVFETDELYLRLMEYKENTGRPIYAYFHTMACSGGYYLSMAADKIIMNRNGITGSIGVTYGTMLDLTGFMEKYGVGSTSIYVGKNKNMGSVYEPLTDEQIDIFMSILQESYDRFTDIVADGRNMPIDTVVKLADGRVYTPIQAEKNGLIDQIGDYKTALGQFKADNGWDDQTPVDELEYQRERTFFEIIFAMAKMRPTELQSVLSLLESPVTGPAYYYQGQ